MNISPAVAPTQDTIKNQSLAGDPHKSIWVSANAGSGKTHILTLRVLRLLLSGIAPENILCLTYTKAAAAEMKSRIAGNLSKWALLNDVDLTQQLQHISGRGPTKEQMHRARTLFALALETPGGLKISTIHAFCEAALHRFPLEANIPVNFSVIEDSDRHNLIQSAKERVLASGLAGNPNVGEAVANLFALMGDKAINDAVNSALGQGRDLRNVLANPDLAKKNLRNLLNADQLARPEKIAQDAVKNISFDPTIVQQVLDQINVKPNQFEKKLKEMNWQDPTIFDFFDLFLTQKGSIPQRGFINKKILDQDPKLAEQLLAQAQQLATTFAQIHASKLIQRSEALLDVMGAIYAQYEYGKAATDQLDFDDLITKFEQLLTSKASSDWVRYKLDAGMTHILVDESQDTNPDQWRVVKLLVEDFFSGNSAAQTTRTIFGVGDEKQSIFGFQGAEPKLFFQTGNDLRRKANQAGMAWENVRFPASFRTLENILKGVDLVCARKDIRQALLSIDSPVDHESARADKGGSITLWPPMEIEKPEDTTNQWLEHPAQSNKSGPRQTGERIVAQISNWIEIKRPHGARGRAVTANDILILVQTRGPIFHEIIRALKQANLPTPGADRLSVTDHILVHDLLALGDILLNPNDDLTLASVLRSPLFDVSLDDLESICIERGNGVSVWQALGDGAKKHKWAEQAYEKLRMLRKNLDRERPYEFFAELLFSHGGLKKFHTRFGNEIGEIADIFLDLALAHEQNPQPSLQGFIAAMRARNVEIKRELSEGGGGVRVMTVHGAKGLEAPIVILADGNKKPQLKQTVFIAGGENPLFVHGSKDDHTPQTIQALREPAVIREEQEYWRKLYVAMTRAEDELYVTGFSPISATDKKQSTQPSWYGAIEEALEGQLLECALANEKHTALRFPLLIPEPKNVSVPVVSEEIAENFSPPSIVQPDENILTIRPSSAFEDEDMTFEASDNQAGPDAEIARLRGTALHLLLEHMVPIDPDMRREIAFHALKNLLPTDPEAYSNLVNKALSILSGPDEKTLFGLNSRAELPIFVFGHKNKRPVQIIGRIDRMIAQEESILLVDFKSNAVPPASHDLLSQQYQTQMGLYLRCGEKLFPHHKISTAIYWTSTENLMALNNDQLYSATRQFNIT